jgi:hypothetical protein
MKATRENTLLADSMLVAWLTQRTALTRRVYESEHV